MNCPTWPGLGNDLAESSLVPPLGTRQAPDSEPVSVMVSTAPDLKTIRSEKGAVSSAPFFNSDLFRMTADQGEICIAGPYIGAPYAAMLLESLIAKGSRKVVVLGWCGALDTALDPGDIVVADSALVHEGTSQNYKDFEEFPWRSDPSVTLTQELVDFIQFRFSGIKTATVWTTDAIYRETRSKALYFRDHGATVVDMECSALFSVAAYHGVEIAAVLTVSDVLILDGDTPVGWEPGFRKSAFRENRKKACHLAIDFAKEISTS